MKTFSTTILFFFEMLISRKPTTLHCWIVLKLSYKTTSGPTIGLRSVSLPPGVLTAMSPTRSPGEHECSQTMIGRDWSQGTRLLLTLLQTNIHGAASRRSEGHVSHCVPMGVGLFPYYGWWGIVLGNRLLQGPQLVPRSVGLLLEEWLLQAPLADCAGGRAKAKRAIAKSTGRQGYCQVCNQDHSQQACHLHMGLPFANDPHWS